MSQYYLQTIPFLVGITIEHRGSEQLVRPFAMWKSKSMTFGKQTKKMIGNDNTNDKNDKSKCSITQGTPTTSFLNACSQCDVQAVRRLLQQKTLTKHEFNARDKTGKTGLCHACTNGFTNIVNLLQATDVDVNIADNEGNTPLIFASQAGHTDIVTLLLNHFPNIDVDQPNHLGFTALMKAAVQGRSKCAKLLLYAGASPYKRDFGRGLCALEWAEYCSRQGCARAIAQFIEACELGLICTNTLDAHLRSSARRMRCKSDTNLPSTNTSDGSSTSGCMPFNLLRKVRRSLPSSGSDSAFSPLQSMEDIGRCLYSPIFPEYCVSPAHVRHYSLLRCKKNIPTLEVTSTSKDDNYLVENPLESATFGYSKFRIENDFAHSL